MELLLTLVDTEDASVKAKMVASLNYDNLVRDNALSDWLIIVAVREICMANPIAA